MSEKYSLYDRHLTRRSNSESAASSSVVLTDDATTEYTSEEISSELNGIEVELLQNFLSLSFISNNIEDTIIVLDEDGNEKPESLERRKRALDKFKAELEKNRNLESRIKEACPELDTNIKNELFSDEYKIYTVSISKLIKLCCSINTVGVHEDEEGYLDCESNSESLDISSIETYDDMLCFIGANLDSISFERATLIERRYIKRKIEEFRELTERNGIEHEDGFMDNINKVARENFTSLGHLEKYSQQIEGTTSKQSNFNRYMSAFRADKNDRDSRD